MVATTEWTVGVPRLSFAEATDHSSLTSTGGSRQRFLDGPGARGDDADRPPDVRDVLLLVVDAQRGADGRQELRHRHRPVLDRRPVVAGRPDHLAALDPAAGEYRAERVGPVVAAVGPAELR